MNPLALLSSLSNLPSIQTRKALLLLDFQNDFVRPNGRLPVPKTQDFIDLIPSLVQSFRRSGEVVWVRTQYEAPRPIIDNYGSEIIITAAGSLDTKSKKTENQGRQKAHSDDTVDPEAFLSNPAPACLPQTTGVQFPAPILTAMDPEHDLVIDKSDYSALQSPGLVLSLRSRFVTELYICGSLSNVSVYATALDAAQQGFSITLIEDCMGYRNFARHEEAIRRLADIVGADGISAQELIEEGDWEENEEIAQASRSSKHDRARPQPKHISRRPEPTGPMAIESVLDHLAVQTSPTLGQQTSPAPKQTDASSVSLHVSEPIEADDDPYPSDEPIILPPTKYLRASNFRANKETRTSSGANTSSRARRNKPSSSPTSSRKSPAASESPIQNRASTSPVLTTGSLKISKNPAASSASGAKKLQSPQQDAAKYAAKGKSTTKMFLGPDDPIAEGDSRIVYGLDLPADAFAKVQKEVNWQKMYHLSGQVPRLVAVQGVVFHDDSYPIYRHPADESPVLERFTATVDAIRRSAEQTVGHELNHVLIQMYRDGQDNISEHSDKTLDIVRGSSIVNVSLGAQRVMTLRTKKSAVTREGDDDSARRKQQVPMPHGSMFILGPASNTRWLHGIRPDKRSESEKSSEEKAFHGQRISLTFRNIGTFTNPRQSTIWGQGAVSKRAETARKVVHADVSETERLIQAFGAENRESDFDWDVVYGHGFDVINFVQPAIARISLSGDPIADLRVRLCLTENGMRYEIVTPVSGQNTQDMVYSSPDGKAVVKGDIQILLHLASLDQNSSLARPGVGIVPKGRFLTEITELDRAWREHLLRGSRSDFDRLAVWNEKFGTIAADGQQSFVAGQNLTIDDLALWPILHQIESQTGVFHASSKYPFLSTYYLRLQKRGCVRVVLDELAHG